MSEFEACLTRGAKGDFTTAVVLGNPTGFRRDDGVIEGCRERFDAVFSSFGRTVRGLGILAEPNTASRVTISRDEIRAPSLGGEELIKELEGLCHWLFWAHRDLEVMFEKIGRPPPVEAECRGKVYRDDRPKLLPTLGEHLSLARVHPAQVIVRDAAGAPSLRDVVAFIASNEDDSPEAVIGRSLDGEQWTGLEVPEDVVIAAPAPVGFVAIARGRTPAAPWQARANDGQSETWRVVGTLPARRDALWLDADGARIALVATRPGTPDVVEVVTSTDGGKRFGAPRSLVDRRGAAVTDVRAMADGTVVALSLPRSTPAEVEIARLGRDGAKADVIRLALAAPIAKPELVGCHGRASYHAIVGGRFLVGSGDSGATWAQVADLGARDTPSGLYCTGERVIVSGAREDGLELIACTAKACEAPARAAGDVEIVFARSQPDHVEVWLASKSEQRHADYRGYIVRVYALASGALTPKRFHVMPRRDRVTVAAHFVDLGDAIGWIDPRSGAGASPWLSTPPP